MLDQHKEHKPKDPVIAASFNTYRLAIFKDSVIDLIGRVTRLSVETARITWERLTQRADAEARRLHAVLALRRRVLAAMGSANT